MSAPAAPTTFTDLDASQFGGYTVLYDYHGRCVLAGKIQGKLRFPLMPFLAHYSNRPGSTKSILPHNKGVLCCRDLIGLIFVEILLECDQNTSGITTPYINNDFWLDASAAATLLAVLAQARPQFGIDSVREIAIAEHTTFHDPIITWREHYKRLRKYEIAALNRPDKFPQFLSHNMLGVTECMAYWAPSGMSMSLTKETRYTITRPDNNLENRVRTILNNRIFSCLDSWRQAMKCVVLMDQSQLENVGPEFSRKITLHLELKARLKFLDRLKCG